ncbi:hypothetical protein JCM19000A_00540 [Silvimonas sp. JCM 19000]
MLSGRQAKVTESKNIVELAAREIIFYSTHDEQSFFEWIKKIPCVEEYSGRGDTLFLYVKRDLLDEDMLRDLIALFHRYGIEMGQLRKFDDESFSEWFNNPEKYWYRSVFG